MLDPWREYRWRVAFALVGGVLTLVNRGGAAEWVLAVSLGLCCVIGAHAAAVLVALGPRRTVLAEAAEALSAFSAAAYADGWVGRIVVVPHVRVSMVIGGVKTNPALRVTSPVVRSSAVAQVAAIECARARSRLHAMKPQMIAGLAAQAITFAITVWCFKQPAFAHCYPAAVVMTTTALWLVLRLVERARRGNLAAVGAGVYVSAAQVLADDTGVRELVGLRADTRRKRLFLALTGGAGFDNDVRRRVITALDSAKG